MKDKDIIKDRDLQRVAMFILELPSGIDSIVEQVKNSFPIYDLTVSTVNTPMMLIRAIDGQVAVDAANMLGELLEGAQHE